MVGSGWVLPDGVSLTAKNALDEGNIKGSEYVPIFVEIRTTWCSWWYYRIQGPSPGDDHIALLKESKADFMEIQICFKTRS
uniref:Uncharacterized protein n=1 Tax=Candidatus Kentrum sp. DK TaxID=2126562 RepID=A0A450SFG4_9GAMM|nr:MAG: hypothetical protein BECKDK2373C_GA0170839_103221 [Candidatus Kentron sp. DK]